MAVATGNYQRVLRLPGVATLLVLMFAARIPVAATNMVLTLHVVLTLHRDYGAAGLVGAVGTIGIAIGAPLTGRLVDAFGLRKMVFVTTIGYGTYWLTAWLLPYPVLLVMSFVGGLLALPVMSVGRQALSALVPPEHRRTAFSLDSISLEMSFMVGPAVGVLIATKVSTTAAVISVGCLLVLAGIAPGADRAHLKAPALPQRPAAAARAAVQTLCLPRCREPHKLVAAGDIGIDRGGADPQYGGVNFVLMVSSIDIRKNQTFLLPIWSRLIRELGREATPDLLLIGKNGHRSHEFLSLLAESAELKGKIIVLNRVRDQELAWYYQRALFTVFPSLAEGWGFPVAESLSFGKVCVSSEIDSIREVGGDLVSYVAANDVGSAYKLIKGLIVNPAERARLESLIANRYQPTQWATAANVILGALSNTKTAR